ncbi:binding-protein-dependent transport systems inner membrane component [Desulforamulus ruminis DSM 2154]|uniref:Binding-protein-dependent transport systems inner membrane component n=1 Tax=Desulforamulus ruminis (strain ATCC 23193 / DSM 2154 / NCIMB 8452 / DL) TaxID=696281 RepID=F6DV66_DESRL|nr:binding-protein-dependent transport systems inner membrane component [Desulforamulus ruminis DSM 2154]
MPLYKIKLRYKNNASGLLTLFSFSLILAAWCGLSYSGAVDNKIFLPTPGAVIQAFMDMQQEGILISYTAVSLYRVLVGWILAVLVAVPMGMMIATLKKAEALLEPVIDFARYLPVVALVPLTLLYFGIGDIQKFVIIFLGTFFQLVLMVSDVVANVSRNLLRAAATLGASQWQIYRLVLMPAALPGIMDSLRITIGWAWTYLVVAELVAANSGLGYLILKSQRFLALDRIFAGLIIIGLLGLATDYFFKWLTRVMVPWSEKVGARHE